MNLKKIICLAIFSINSYADQLPYILTDLLPTYENLKEKNSEFIQKVSNELNFFIKASEEKRYQDAYEVWVKVCNDFFHLQLLCHQTFSLSSNIVLKGYEGTLLVDLYSDFRKQIQNKKIIDTFIQNGFNASLLTPFQRDLTEKVLLSIYNPNSQSLETLRKYERRNYIYEKNERNSPISIGNRLSVLTANLICFRDPLSYFFGGASPAVLRIDEIAKKILKTKADIVCLQEVWDEEALKVLKERLKNDYVYFVYEAGNQTGTLSPDEIGFNSGLFIASKVHLEELDFSLFSEMKQVKGGIKRGALHARFKAGNSYWKMVATHLQHGSDQESIKIRNTQFQNCSELVGDEKGFVIGDLNINAFSEEFKESLLSSEFIVPYLRKKSNVTEKTATATNYFNDLVHTPLEERALIKPSFELIDYCVIPKKSPHQKILSQERVVLFSINNPTKALSDHHGLLTVWKVQ
jgi:endonuclease/exonuclease/phosphatase family metal-dependent hydrolase